MTCKTGCLFPQIDEATIERFIGHPLSCTRSEADKVLDLLTADELDPGFCLGDKDDDDDNDDKQ